MYYRKIMKDIDKWHDSLKIKKRALIIRGLRQVGKTTVVKEYAKTHYDNVVYINFMDNKSIKKIFDNDFIINDMIRDLSAAIRTAKFIPNKTVIIFDELQECVNARASIKAFMLDGRFDIIATGSLLGLRGYNQKKSKGIPTGFEYPLTMYPMDFYEYLLAKGIDESLINYLKECYEEHKIVSDTINTSFLNHFKEYICVGGMPDVVSTFLSTSDLNQVLDVQRALLQQYQDDFGKHLDENESEFVNKKELTKIMEVYYSIPNQLAKENKKFQYSVIKKNGKGRDYRDAITWLSEFGFIDYCYNLSIPELPLEGNKIDDEFKIYVTDTGLFVAMLEDGAMNNIISGDLKIYKGAITENVIADSFVKSGKKLYYYSKSSGLEIDFVTRVNNELTLIEVKSTNGNSKSIKEVLNNKDKYMVSKAIKLVDGNIGENNNIYTIPLYMAFLLK